MTSISGVGDGNRNPRSTEIRILTRGLRHRAEGIGGHHHPEWTAWLHYWASYIPARHATSINNPKNPNNPTVPVGWGERTVDEMCLAFLGVIFDNEPFLQLPFSVNK